MVFPILIFHFPISEKRNSRRFELPIKFCKLLFIIIIIINLKILNVIVSLLLHRLLLMEIYLNSILRSSWTGLICCNCYCCFYYWIGSHAQSYGREAIQMRPVSSCFQTETLPARSYQYPYGRKAISMRTLSIALFRSFCSVDPQAHSSTRISQHAGRLLTLELFNFSTSYK